MNQRRGAGLRAPTRTRLADQVAAVLLDAILDGELATGSLLPPERELAEELDVNRTSLRQAIARLEQMGLVEARQGRGTVVRDLADATDPALMAHLVARDQRRVLAELFEIREALAGLIGRLAATHVTATGRTKLRRALDAVAATETAPERQAAELAFFRDLVALTRNRPLGAMQQWVDQAYGDAADHFEAAFADAAPVLDGLTAIVDAVDVGDEARAADATTAYAAASAARLLAAVAPRRARR